MPYCLEAGPSLEAVINIRYFIFNNVKNILLTFLFHRQIKSYISLRGMDTLSGVATLSKLFCLPSEKGSTLKGKNLLPLGANSFLLEYTPFQKGLSVQVSKQ